MQTFVKRSFNLAVRTQPLASTSIRCFTQEKVKVEEKSKTNPKEARRELAQEENLMHHEIEKIDAILKKHNVQSNEKLLKKIYRWKYTL